MTSFGCPFDKIITSFRSNLIILLCLYLFSAVLPGAELWHDRQLSSDDLEGSDGGDWQ